MDTADLKIQKYSSKGHGLALYQKKELEEPQTIEIAHVVQGDLVRVELMRKNKRKKKGKLLEVLSASKDRVVARCEHATICGGCTWQQVDYLKQVAQKQLWVQTFFQKFLEKADLLYPILFMEDPWHYRNKMEFSFSENRAKTRFLGLMIAQGASYVFNVNTCHIAPKWFSIVLQAVRAWWEKTGVLAFQFRDNTGILRNLTLREGRRTSQKMAMLTVSGSPDEAFKRPEIQSFVEAVQESIDSKEISIFLRVQQTAKGMPTQFYEMHLAGPDHITEKLQLKIRDKELELLCKISPTSFFQPNSLQAEKLYEAAFTLLGDTQEDLIYDLYCGTGTLTMIASFFAKKVIGIELHPESIFDAEENLQKNNITNVQFYQGDVGKTVTKLMVDPNFEKPSLVIVDPPRAGLDPLAIHDLKQLMPARILYISCNPATQVTNVEELIQLGYQIQAIQPVDQFPHTAHIENIVLLKKV